MTDKGSNTKSKLPSRHVSVGPKSAPHRSMYYAMGLTEEEIYQTLRKITDPLTRSWSKIEKAKKVVIKFNMMKLPDRIEYFRGRRRELVDDAVCRAILRLIKEHTMAQLIATDTNPYNNGNLMPEQFNYLHLLKEFDVQFVDQATILLHVI